MIRVKTAESTRNRILVMSYAPTRLTTNGGEAVVERVVLWCAFACARSKKFSTRPIARQRARAQHTSTLTSRCSKYANAEDESIANGTVRCMSEMNERSLMRHTAGGFTRLHILSNSDDGVWNDVGILKRYPE